MAPHTQGDDQNDASTSQPQTEEATVTTSIGTLTSPLPSIPPSDSPNAQPLPTLPFELLTEILYRLPAKFLLQFKCVCKSWKSLISDPKFAKKHLRVSTKCHNLILTSLNLSRELTLTAYPLSSVFTGVTASPMHLEYPLSKFNDSSHFVGSCDGILCFSDLKDEENVILFNPSIRKFKSLPEMMKIPRKKASNSTAYSFGYDHVSHDYKVVGVFCYQPNHSGFYKTIVRVYTLSTNCWRRIQDFPSGDRFLESGKFVSGTINWLTSIPSGDFSISRIIVSLDLGNESYKEILQPDLGSQTLTLGVLRDCLCIVSHHRTCSDIWIMKEYGNKESWTKLFTVCGPDFFYFTKPLYASQDGRVLLVLAAQPNLVLYNSGDSTFPDIPVSWKDPELYIESLVSPCF